ncbi:uncharacterized protein [Euphorbia lathyris]|uniref:uncharacterized protein n=1 Tax=Euphorbia lathyris TaxID=212925 RepID=UPI0033131C82
MAGRLKEILKKYGKVAFVVHCSVSAASITGLYIAIKNNVDVESLFDRLHLPGISAKESDKQSQDGSATTETAADVEKKRNRAAELAASAGGAFTMALLCNKALFPIRVPITLAVTPPLAKFLARRGIIKSV